MRDLESIVDEILKKKPNVNRSTVYSLINEKKGKIGSGYLTDTGAAYLVAADLGVMLDFEPPSVLEIKDLYIGSNAVNLNCRVCSVSEIKTYKRKDGTEGNLLTIILFDRSGLIRCNLWDSKALDALSLNLKIDDAVHIKKAYVKSDFNNSPVLHVGQNGSIERIEDKSLSSQLMTLKDIAIPLDDFIPRSNLICIKAVVYSAPTISTFSRKDGSQGNVQSFIISGLKKSIKNRVVLWLPVNVSRNIPPVGSTIILCPLKNKSQTTGDIEFHGDEKTVILTMPNESPFNSFKKSLSISLRLISIGIPQKTRKGSPSINALAMGDDGTIFTLIGLDEVVPFLISMKLGDKIEGSYTLLDENKLLCTDVNKISKKIKSEPFEIATLYKKISQIKASANEKQPFFLKVVAISQAVQREVRSKNGEKIQFSEILVGDETDEINLIAWRGLSQLIDQIKPGERLIINGVVLRTKPVSYLEVRPFSTISKIYE
jgi:replication factor A1